MATTLPTVLKHGDEIRIIAPSSSLAIIATSLRTIAKDRLEGDLGLKVTFSKHVEKKNKYGSSSAKDRLDDLHEAFADKNVKAIMAVIGGDNAVELLHGLKFNVIKRNPKIFCGYSDTTVLGNAIYAKTGLATFSGPSYSSFGMKRGFEYTLEAFKKATMGLVAYNVLPSVEFSDDQWYKNQNKRSFSANKGLKALKLGKAKGTIVGGNVSSLALLQGTVCMPKLENSILFLEDCAESTDATIMRQLISLFNQPGIEKLRGIVFGRFQKTNKLTHEDLKYAVSNSPIAKLNIPIIADADFGHTSPMFTFAVGGTAEISASTSSSTITFQPFVKA